MSSISIEIFKKLTPWFVKIPAKMVLSRLPISRRTWQRFNLFRAGTMDSPAAALAIFRKHFDSTGLRNLQDRTILELGPGNGTLTALFAKAFGAARIWLVDVEELASQDMTLFDQAARMLTELGFAVPQITGVISVREVLARLNASYLTKGLESLKTIPDGAIDFLFSHAVLEHVRLADFRETAREMRRVLSYDGVASHEIDFRDHLQNALNNLRFSQRVWESDFMVNSGFYTNRIQWPEMKKIFEDAGFSVQPRSICVWPNGLPTVQKKMAAPFRDIPGDQLMVMGARVLLRPAKSVP